MRPKRHISPFASYTYFSTFQKVCLIQVRLTFLLNPPYVWCTDGVSRPEVTLSIVLQMAVDIWQLKVNRHDTQNRCMWNYFLLEVYQVLTNIKIITKAKCHTLDLYKGSSKFCLQEPLHHGHPRG